MISSALSTQIAAQGIGVYGKKDKLIYKIGVGKSLDFRIDYEKVFPKRDDSILEVRLYSVLDSIDEETLHLTENQIVMQYTGTRSILVEKETEMDLLKVDFKDIEAVSFTTTGESVGNALFVIGLAAMVVSPLFGFNSGSYAPERVVLVAGMGAGSALIGGAFSLLFKQDPVQIKEFDGPQYFKKYQKGHLSIVD